jgi:HEAT repeat protein
MSFASRLAALPARLAGALYAGFGALDDGLVWVGNRFGATITSPTRRYAALLGIFAAIYLLGALHVPVLPLLALGVGYVGVLAISRAWVRNENRRAEIVKRLADGNPDTMPDLRWTALVSALQLILLFPLIFYQIHRHFPRLYKVPEGATFGTWVLFTADAYNKVLLSLFNLYGVHFDTPEPASSWGRHLILFGRLTIEYLLIQGLFRLYAIYTSVQEAVGAVIRDPSLAVYVGRRAVRPLVRRLEWDTDAPVRRRAAEVLGKLDDSRAVEPLLRALNQGPDEGLRAEAARALGRLHARGAVRALAAAVLGPSDAVAAEASWALGEIRDLTGAFALLAALDRDSPAVRAQAARALGAIGEESAPEYLIELAVRDPDEDVRTAALEALKARWPERALAGLVEVLKAGEQKVGWWGKLFGARKSAQEFVQEVSESQSAAEALGDLGDPRAFEALAAALHDPRRLVRRAAAEALGKVGGVPAIEPLVEALSDRERDVRARAAQALGAIGDVRAYRPLLTAWKEDREAEVRLASAEALLKLAPEHARAEGVT